jgi:hypothetical protein
MLVAGVAKFVPGIRGERGMTVAISLHRERWPLPESVSAVATGHRVARETSSAGSLLGERGAPQVPSAIDDDR